MLRLGHDVDLLEDEMRKSLVTAGSKGRTTRMESFSRQIEPIEFGESALSKMREP